MVDIAWYEDPGDGDDRVRRLLLAVAEVDGRPEIDASGPLPRELRGGRYALAMMGQQPVGYLHLNRAGDAFGRQIAEMYVHPGHRNRGIGGRLAAELLASIEPTANGGRQAGDRLRAWSHGDHPAAAALAARHGFARVREMWQMMLDLATAELPELRLPEHVTLRTFRPGHDEDAVVAVNARAFSWHPEQGAMTAADLAAAEQEGWFDPGGFFLAESSTGELLGFHWTKVHPDGTGEVYVVGVDPSAQGGGLGKALTLTGLHHLEAIGLSRVMLYVEADNAAAVAVYRKLGFEITQVDVQYAW